MRGCSHGGGLEAPRRRRGSGASLANSDDRAEQLALTRLAGMFVEVHVSRSELRTEAAPCRKGKIESKGPGCDG